MASDSYLSTALCRCSERFVSVRVAAPTCWSRVRISVVEEVVVLPVLVVVLVLELVLVLLAVVRRVLRPRLVSIFCSTENSALVMLGMYLWW